MVKPNQRLTTKRIAEALSERGVSDWQVLHDALQVESRGERPFAEALVKANHVGDWELSQIVCEVYGLPFVPVEVAPPDRELIKLVDHDFLRKNCLVPVVRYGQTLTVSMPGIVPSETLSELEKLTELTVLPVVGTVRSNRNWLDEHVGQIPDPALPSIGEWGSIFDQGDAAVLLELDEGIEE